MIILECKTDVDIVMVLLVETELKKKWIKVKILKKKQKEIK
jgi:hypothetical protein